MYALTVTHHFADYQPGDKIVDPREVKAVIEGDNAGKVVRVGLPDVSELPGISAKII